MELEGLSGIKPRRDVVLTIGVFDGVHLGHQHLISRVTEKAVEEGLLGGVVTFDRHPRLVLGSKTPLTYLTGLEERKSLIKGMGIDFVAVLTFTPKLAATSARDFVLGLREHLRMRAIVIGPGFALGRGREGDESTLRSLGEEFDFTVEVASLMTIDGEVVSSTSIRNALSIGDMARVRRFLGRPFTLDGQVVPGREGGKGLGFPTANLAVDEERAIPANGVYITRAYLDGRPYNSVTNIGTRPTFGEGERVVETYILDFDGDIYAHWLTIELLERMRGEMRFTSGKELGEQIARDVQRAREWLEHHGD